MARFYFDLNLCGTLTLDREGRECQGPAAIRHLAVAAARDIITAERGRGALCLDCSISVRDADGHVCQETRFCDAPAMAGRA